MSLLTRVQHRQEHWYDHILIFLMGIPTLAVILGISALGVRGLFILLEFLYHLLETYFPFILHTPVDILVFSIFGFILILITIYAAGILLIHTLNDRQLEKPYQRK